ncbi:urea transporter [Cantharellus anzutake]|uniref:urea transporter n=1 Tax=Cantharellus anzutake TaxID=1750568 RepID=UPI0019074518|nr:urea transporter [Cantharellus anzutake]KAF8325239.1 urea transporter [Cantharellus anzutake]
MIMLTWIQARYTPFSPSNTEEFSSASRSVKSGLIASGIVSAWTWAATLLQSSAVAYKYGISGPYWYGSGATIQVLLFAMLSAKLKSNAPRAHTWLEVVNARWGAVAHQVFMFFGLATNVIVSAMLCLGGSATVTSLTGMDTIAACFLIPIGVTIYVVVGGMRATLLCDYTHTTVLFAIILTFVFTVYATSEKIGSFRKMHELLTAVSGNAHGSYLTMRSKNGLIFGVINAYYQRAIASKGTTTVRAFLLGGLAWFSIPFTFATTLGLAAVLSPADVGAGLPAPSAAAALLGKSGAAIMLVLLFLAVTSATSAELIAVSSILTYDVYKRYFNPQATEAQILMVSRIGIFAFGLFIGLSGVIFKEIGVNLGWLYMGTLLGSAVVPIALCITWKKANKMGCIIGSCLGLVFGIMAWLIATSKLNDGKINVTTTGGDYEMLTGNLVAIAIGGIIAVAASVIWPEDFDFNRPGRAISQLLPFQTGEKHGKDDEEKPSHGESIGQGRSPDVNLMPEGLDLVELKKAFNFAATCSIILTAISIIIVPLPLFFSSVIFGVRGYSAWVTIGIIWVFSAIAVVVFLPLYESREALIAMGKGIIKDIYNPGSGKFIHHPHPQGPPASTNA